MSTEACCCKAAGLIKKSCVHGALVGSVTQGAIGAVSGALSGAVTHRITTGSWKGAGQAALDGAATGFMTGTITGAISGAVSSPYCFVAGTTVLTAAGAAAIETIEVGDYVWAWDENTKDVALKQVVETYVNETDELVHVFVNGEEIVTTPAHPFYSPVKGWTDAVHLRAGDILVLVNGEYVVVEKVQHELLENPVKVYNFQVEDYHTYYVAAPGVLEHNLCKQQKVAGNNDGWNAKVSVGGEANHMNSPHAHIFYKHDKIASVNEFGGVIAGKLNKAGRRFVKEALPQIADGIKRWWYYGQ